MDVSFSSEDSLVLRYESQSEDNEPNYRRLNFRLKEIVGKEPEKAPVHADKPIQSSGEIRGKVEDVASRIINRTVLIDIPRMTHLWALSTILDQ
jgi:hypothetical protein